MRPILVLLNLLLFPFVKLSEAALNNDQLFNELFPVQPPHCSRTPVVIAQTSRDVSSHVRGGMQMQFPIGLGTAVCFRLQRRDGGLTTSWLHTIRLAKLEHHHPISQRYEFGIPEASAECKCECDQTAASCSADTHLYKDCDTNIEDQTCYRTFFPNQAPIGCAEEDIPKMCCELKFRPLDNETYTAVKLEQPSTFATFEYKAYDYVKGKWQEQDEKVIRTQLDLGTQDRIVDSLHKISLAVAAGGRASHQLESGMYFTKSNPGGEMEELRMAPLNEITDNNFDRLGWYRKRADGTFHVQNGIVRLQDVHKAKSTNCKEQKYQSVLAAQFYEPSKYNLSRPLEASFPWIQSARIYDGSRRQAVVTHSQGTNLQITLQLTQEADEAGVEFYHNASKIRDFSGTIIVDSRSNRFLNLTVYGASGKIDGVVKFSPNPQSNDLYSFTTFVNELNVTNRSLIVPLPAIVDDGQRMICLKADEMPLTQGLCRIIQYYEVPLEIDLVSGTWRYHIGHCPDCNKRQYRFDSFTKFFNPSAWLNGVKSVGDGVHLVISLVGWIAVMIMVMFIIKYIVYPLCKCFQCLKGLGECLCPNSYGFNNSSSHRKDHHRDRDKKIDRNRERRFSIEDIEHNEKRHRRRRDTDEEEERASRV
ncbi:hypothetical protein WR25_25393 [Diploscapter pachys]|uniref:Uncharacterized protein n=1 Tax=Diploscapter pachys TaxID=2018661 RepID=A0A2A2JRB8_9BILA|nr:hypothetical protein WR25_25393 [Diploscapter pachys]